MSEKLSSSPTKITYHGAEGAAWNMNANESMSGITKPEVVAPSPELLAEASAPIAASEAPTAAAVPLYESEALKGPIRASELPKTPAPEVNPADLTPPEAAPEVVAADAAPKVEAVAHDVAETTAGLTEADLSRIRAEAKTYFDQFDELKTTDENGRDASALKSVLELRGNLDELAKQAAADFQAELTALGFDGEALKDMVAKQVKDVVRQKIEDKTKEFVQSIYPNTAESRKDRRKVDKKRDGLEKLLQMDQAGFDKLAGDWQAHNRDQLHTEALSKDKSIKIGEKRQGARAKMAELNSEYGGVLDAIGDLPLDKAEGGPADSLLKSYMEKRGKIDDGNAEFVDGLQAVNVEKTATELQAHLKEQYEKIRAQHIEDNKEEGVDKEVLTDEQILSKVQESTKSLEAWLQKVGPEDQPLESLKKFEQQKNVDVLLTAKRQKAAEYLGSSLIARFGKGLIGMEKGPSQRQVSIAEAMERGVDHDGSRAKAGAEALRKSGTESSLVGRVMSQLEMARNLGRNEGLMRASLLYGNFVINSMGDASVTAWEQIPEEKKKQARKKLELGMAATAKSLKALKAKAAQKALQKLSKPAEKEKT